MPNKGEQLTFPRFIKEERQMPGHPVKENIITKMRLC